MGLPGAVEFPVGVLLVFFLPGYAVTKAVFPDWRIRGPDAYRRLLEIVTLAFVLSVVLTILVGYGLLVGAPGGFAAYWSSPVLEAALAGIALAALAAAFARGAFAREPPPSPRPLEDTGGEEGAWELTRELDRLAREGRQIRRSLREGTGSAGDEARLRDRLTEIEARVAELGRQREAEYAD